MANNVMVSGRRTRVAPIAVPKTTRNHDVRVLTSLPAGRMVPVVAIPLLREDALRGSRLRLSFESMETAEILMNAINVKVRAHLVPHLAFERFSGMDELNRAYEGIPNQEGGAVTPYIVKEAYNPTGNDIMKYLGKHAKTGTMVNTAYVEAYNVLWNWIARNRSEDLPQRGINEKTLAPAFWMHGQFDHIVPDFDQAVIDGAAPLGAGTGSAPVRGMYFSKAGTPSAQPASVNWKDASGAGMPAGNYRITNSADPNGGYVEMKQIAGEWLPQIRAELGEAGLTLSLSAIELARKTQAFARLRAQYTGLTEEYLIDLLMDGITVPEQSWRQPILLGEKTTIFGMAKRYASDGDNLTESVVNGATFVDLIVSTPPVPCGGVVLVTVEILPEQLFERHRDPYLMTTDVAGLPQYLRDTLDPEKVEVVTGGMIDSDHDTPDVTFGYAPLNHWWNIAQPCVGGVFHRPEVDAPFDEDRQRLWAVEQQNPQLGEDFYISTNIHTKPFVVTNRDPFEVIVRGGCLITGNTVFGGALVEASNDYEEVLEEAPTERIVKDV